MPIFGGLLWVLQLSGFWHLYWCLTTSISPTINSFNIPGTLKPIKSFYQCTREGLCRATFWCNGGEIPVQSHSTHDKRPTLYPVAWPLTPPRRGMDQKPRHTRPRTTKRCVEYAVWAGGEIPWFAQCQVNYFVSSQKKVFLKFLWARMMGLLIWLVQFEDFGWLGWFNEKIPKMIGTSFLGYESKTINKPYEFFGLWV